MFEEITRLDEYYPTRTETAILRQNTEDISTFAGREIALLEYRAGSGIKTEILLRALDVGAYVPVDIARDFLQQTHCRIAARFPHIGVTPIEADFTSAFDIRDEVGGARRVAFFPGSTIGNLDRRSTLSFLHHMHRHVGADGAAIVGVDLVKGLDVLLPAYDDKTGVTANFNLNLLARVNRELQGTFALEQFAHEARWNRAEQAVEMHIVSLRSQFVKVGSHSFAFREGESIHTESSRKFDLSGFSGLVEAANWQVAKIWSDEAKSFAVFGLTPAAEAAASTAATRFMR